MTETDVQDDAGQMNDEQYRRYCDDLYRSLEVLLYGHHQGVVLEVGIGFVLRAAKAHAFISEDMAILDLMTTELEKAKVEVAEAIKQQNAAQ